MAAVGDLSGRGTEVEDCLVGMGEMGRGAVVEDGAFVGCGGCGCCGGWRM